MSEQNASDTAHLQRLSDWRGTACLPGPAGTKGSWQSFKHPVTGKPIFKNDNPKGLSWEIAMKLVMRETAFEHPSGVPNSFLRAAVQVEVTIYVARPLSHYSARGGLKASAPSLPASGKDVDKVSRCVLDAGHFAWWQNDAQVQKLTAERLWGDERVEVTARVAPGWLLGEARRLEADRQRTCAHVQGWAWDDGDALYYCLLCGKVKAGKR